MYMVKSKKMIFMLLFSASFICFVLFMILSIYNMTLFVQLNLFTVNSISFETAYIFDSISLSFMSLVLLISGSVFMFSEVYMSEDPSKLRFTFILLSFVISMCLLIMSSSLFTMLLGWDGLGITSFALIIYYSSFESKQAGFKTLLINRIGDVLIMLSFFCFLHEGSFMLSFVLGSSVFLFKLASLTKSAQYPFSSWLPAAMAAPTPVSALVHSSTLVTAGIYLLIRVIVTSDYSEFSCNLLLFLGAITSFLGGLAAVFENDLKKIIALSTLSQLGVMMFTIGMGYPYLALFHLFMHALFKAMLFLAAGNILMMSFGCQDIRLLGGIGGLSPVTNVVLNVSCLSLFGIPFMSAYYSKHMIMEKLFLSNMNLFSGVMMLIATIFTLVYTYRLLLSISWSKNLNVLSNINTSALVYAPMIILLLFSIVSGKLYSNSNFDIMEISMIPKYGNLYLHFLILFSLLIFLLISSKKVSFLLSSLFYLSPLYYKSSYVMFPIMKYLSILDYGWLDLGNNINMKLSKNSYIMMKVFKWPS